MDKQHTRGPWAFEYDVLAGYDAMSGAFTIVMAASPLSSIAVIDLADYGQDMCQAPSVETLAAAEANARLIAAAPTMLAALEKAEQALKDIINAADNGEPYNAEELQAEFMDDCNAVHEAIASATNSTEGE